MIIRRRGGPVRTVARTAAVVGTATAVSHGIGNRMDKQQQEAAQMQPPANGPQPSDMTTQLQQLSDLKAQGALSEEEFQAAKKKLMQS